MICQTCRGAPFLMERQGGVRVFSRCPHCFTPPLRPPFPPVDAIAPSLFEAAAIERGAAIIERATGRTMLVLRPWPEEAPEATLERAEAAAIALDSYTDHAARQAATHAARGGF